MNGMKRWDVEEDVEEIINIRALLRAFFGDVIEIPEDLKKCCKICIIK